MRRALAPSRSETKLDNLMWASSRRDSNWFCNRTLSRVNWYFLRVTVRHRRCSASGTKLRVNSRATSRFTSRSASGKSLLRPPSPAIGLRLRQVQRSGPPACAFSLLANRLPVPFQCIPYGLPVLGRRFHNHFLGLLLEQPRSQRSQFFGVAAK